MARRKENIYSSIGKEIINETITSGLSLILVFAGISYFALKFSWFKLVDFFLGLFGTGGTAIHQELSLMGNAIANTYPFRFIFNVDGYNFIILGIIITVIGLILKILTTRTKGEFIRGLGGNLKVPGIIGLVVAGLVQIISTITLTSQQGIAIAPEVLTGISIWSKFSFIFIAGFITLLTGALVYYIIRSPKIKRVTNKIVYYKFKIISKAAIRFGLLSLGYYFLIRIILLFKGTLISNYLYLLFATETMPINMILLCFICITVGREIELLGISLMKKRHKGLNHQSQKILRPKVHPKLKDRI
jgi:hypothetical protein